MSSIKYFALIKIFSIQPASFWEILVEHIVIKRFEDLVLNSVSF